jgi:hypothetical protein
MSMKSRVVKFSKRFGAAAAAVAGLIAAATAHANPGKDLGAALPAELRDSLRQCSDVDAILTKLQFPAGTTFLLTDAGLVVLSQPKAASDPLPDWPNSGN